MQEMPLIIYGTAWKKERTADLVEAALLAGFRGIDTACQPKHYQEDLVGEGIARAEAQGVKRSELFLQTKFTPLDGQDPARLPYPAEAPIGAQVRQSFAKTQNNLRTSSVDSYVLHGPYSQHEQTMEAWQAMEKLYQQNLVGQLGISNCYSLPAFKKIYEEATVKPAVIQNRFYQDTAYDRELRAWASERGVRYQSFWTLTANPQILKNRGVQQIAIDHGRTEAQVFFRALTQLGIVPLTGTTSAQHMREDLEIADFSLNDVEMRILQALLKS